MDGLSAAATVVAVIETAWKVINYIKGIKGAGEARQKLILELVRATGLLSTLNDIVRDARDEEWSRALQSLDGPNGPLKDFKVLLEEIIVETGMKSGSAPTVPIRSPVAAVLAPVRAKMKNEIYHTVKDLKWPFTEPTTQELLTKLERIKTIFLLALSCDNVRLSKLIQTELQTVHSKMSVVEQNTAAILEHQRGARGLTNEQRLIFQSISTLDFSWRGNPENLEQLKQGADWFLNHSDFRHWRTGGSKSTLLLTGMPGSGKTSISRVVSRFLQDSGTSSEVFVVGIYLSWSNQPEKQTLQAILAFIVSHMLDAHPRFQKYYNKLMLTGEYPLSVEDSLRIIHRAQQDFQHFYLILDALDECDQSAAHEVIERLTRLHRPLRVFVTMRNIPLANQVSNAIKISTREELTLDDIRSYVNTLLREYPPVGFDLSNEDDAAELDILTDKIVAGSNGAFLRAKLISQQIQNAPRKTEIYQYLESSPLTLEETYASWIRNLANQNEADATLGKRVLKEVLSADRPMNTEELLDVVAGDAEWEAGDRGQTVQRVDRCVKCCMNFICVLDDKVRIVHMSAMEFLNGPRGVAILGQN